jgi:uncharacterized protein YbjT (DUF2867 family)
MTVLVTGGTGALGTQVVNRLLARAEGVRITSRRVDAAVPEGVGLVMANLHTGEGFETAVSGVDTVVHLATSFTRAAADIEGTRALLAAAADAGVGNFFYMSIVGIDRQPIGGYPYYRAKLETEGIIEGGHVPWTILRATQFHTLVLRALRASDRLPWQAVFAGVRFQLLDTGDVADQVVAAIAAGPRGRMPDIAGPREESMESLARAYLRHRGDRKPLLKIPVNLGFGRGFVRGQNLAPTDRQQAGLDWEDFLSRQPGLRAAA